MIIPGTIMTDKPFNEQMSSCEASLALLKAVKGKGKEDIKVIKDDYFAICQELTNRKGV